MAGLPADRCIVTRSELISGRDERVDGRVVRAGDACRDVATTTLPCYQLLTTVIRHARCHFRCDRVKERAAQVRSVCVCVCVCVNHLCVGVFALVGKRNNKKD